MKKYLRLSFVFALAGTLLFSVTSCDNDAVDQEPELPPVESMMMDFSDFSDQPAGAKGTADNYQNFARSYFTVGIWNISVTLVSALPVAAYAHALQQQADYLGDNTWEWSYEFSLNNESYSANLTAMRKNNEEFSVEMLIANSDSPDEGVKWFDGVVRYDQTKADWVFYKDGTIPVLEIDWNKDFESEAADLTYTYTEPGQAESGSYIRWEYIPEAVYDAAYTISTSEGTSHIEWNVTTIEGRIKDSEFFGDDAWHCWDSYANGLADIDCN